MRTEHRRSFVSATSFFVILCSIGGLPAARAGQSLKDLARANGGRTSRIVMVNMPFLPLSRLAAESDVIVQGQVTRVESRLSSDEEAVLTDISLTPYRFFKGGSATTARVPGPVRPVVFVQRGGTVNVDGLEISHHEQSGVDPPLRAGDEVIAFLRKGDEPGTLWLSYGAYGLLRVQGDKVTAGSRRVAKERPLESDKVSEVQKVIITHSTSRGRGGAAPR